MSSISENTLSDSRLLTASNTHSYPMFTNPSGSRTVRVWPAMSVPAARSLVHQQLLHWKALQKNSPWLSSSYQLLMHKCAKRISCERVQKLTAWLSEDILNISCSAVAWAPTRLIFSSSLIPCCVRPCKGVVLPFPPLSHSKRIEMSVELYKSQKYSCLLHACYPPMEEEGCSLQEGKQLQLNSLPFHRLTWQK